MTTRSIFQKVCPSCMATVPVDSRECSCGHLFDHDDAGASLSSEQIRLQAEELYENYLAARVEQATSAAHAARAAYARDPASLEKSDEVARAMREVEAAKLALAEQSARTAEMRKALPPAAPRPAPVPAPLVSKKRAAPPKPITPPPVRVVRQATTAAIDVAASAASRAKRATKPAVQHPTRNIPTAVTALKEPLVVHPKPVQTATPNPVFRQAQAAKAEKILRAKRNTKPVPVIKNKEAPPAPVVEKKIAPAVSLPTPTKSAPRLYAVEKRKDCPNCTSSVDSNTARCRCGYEFPSSEVLIPPLAMSDEERAEFAKLFNFP